MPEVSCVIFCKALADETRQRILTMLQEQELCVSDIVGQLHLSQPAVSHHLGVLKQAGLVTDRKEGKRVIYALDVCCLQDCCVELMTELGVATTEAAC